MAHQVQLPIINNEDCVSFYKVEYKRSTDTEFIRVQPDQVGSPLIIQPLDDCTTYNIRVTKRCCNGQDSDMVTLNVTTGGDC